MLIETSDDRVSWQLSLREEGFALIPAIFAQAEIQTFLGALNVAEQHRSRAGMRHLLRHPTIAELANDQRLLGKAQQILGDNAFPFRATLFDKSPHSNWLISWHQDTALPLQERRDSPGWGPWSSKEGVIYAHAPASALIQVLALRLHIDDCTEENGPLRVLPGTHIMGVLNDDQVLQLARERSAVECVVERGGVLAMRPLIVHASSKSRSPQPRRVLHIEYALKEEIGPRLVLAMS